MLKSLLEGVKVVLKLGIYYFAYKLTNGYAIIVPLILLALPQNKTTSSEYIYFSIQALLVAYGMTSPPGMLQTLAIYGSHLIFVLGILGTFIFGNISLSSDGKAKPPSTPNKAPKMSASETWHAIVKMMRKYDPDNASEDRIRASVVPGPYYGDMTEYLLYLNGKYRKDAATDDDDEFQDEADHVFLDDLQAPGSTPFSSGRGSSSKYDSPSTTRPSPFQPRRPMEGTPTEKKAAVSRAEVLKKVAEDAREKLRNSQEKAMKNRRSSY